MKLEEKLLDSWLGMSLTISNKRLTHTLSFNEAMVYHLLYQRADMREESAFTATELCKEMNMLKSQMNVVLNKMEKKDLIERVPSQGDKRQILIRLRPETMHVYEEEHERILKIVSSIVNSVGTEKIQELIPLLGEVTAHMRQYANQEK